MVLSGRFMLAVAVLWVSLFSGIGIRLASTRTPLRPITFDPSLLPGQPLPLGRVRCDEGWYAHYDAYGYCSLTDSTSHMYVGLTYHYPTGRIQRTSFLVRDLRIGDLLLVWGEPRGVQYTRWGVTLYWSGRSAQVFGKGFSPYSQRVLMSFFEPEEQPRYRTWRGFR
jgi:hypothetical protein